MIDSSVLVEPSPVPWFVIWTQARAEKKVEARIAALGLETWLPTKTERHRWSDRWKDVVSPLFPGYLFARATSVEWFKVLRTPGVLTVVKERGGPALLAPDFIAHLRKAIESTGSKPEIVSDELGYSAGDEVVVQEGPLQGIRGVVRELRNRRQLVIWISEIGHGVAITIGKALVRPAGECPSSRLIAKVGERAASARPERLKRRITRIIL